MRPNTPVDANPTKPTSGRATAKQLQFSSDGGGDGSVPSLPLESEAVKPQCVSDGGGNRNYSPNSPAAGDSAGRAVSSTGEGVLHGRAAADSGNVLQGAAPRSRRDSARPPVCNLSFGSPTEDGATLRPYQEVGVQFLVDRKGALLGDAMGAGKTCQLVRAAALTEPKRVLILTTKHNLHTWARELRRWWIGPLPTVVLYSGPLRATALASAGGAPSLVVVTNFGLEGEAELRRGRWDLLIVDESHKGKNHKIARYTNLSLLAKRSGRVWLASGTPIRNHPVDLIPQAMLVGATKHYWPTVDKWFATCPSEFGHGIEIGGIRNKIEFKKWCSTWMLRRTKKEALPGLPSKIRKKLYVEMSPEQRRLYDALVNELGAEIEGSDPSSPAFVLTPNALSLVTRLRQLLVAPQLLGCAFRGSALEAAGSWVRDLTEENVKGVIFTPFRKAIPYIDQATGLNPHEIAHFHGSQSPQAVAKQLELFRKPYCKVAVCTIQVAEGFSLTEATEGLFLGCEWTAASNHQAEDRLHRFGQNLPTRIQYVVHEGTVEEDILALLDTKASYASIIERIVR